LHDIVHNIRTLHWEMNTDIEAVFQMILCHGKTWNISPENMPKQLFIFTDMEFDAAQGQKDEKVLFDSIREMYKDSGYLIPKLIFWNLRPSDKKAFPVRVSENNVAYVSGFSAELLKVFSEGIDFNPLTILEKLVSRYEVEVDESELGKLI